MSSAKKLVGAGSLYTLATLAPVLTLLFVTPFITRAMGPKEYGSVAVAITLYQLTAALAPLGLTAAVTRHAILLDGRSPAAAGLVAKATLVVVLLALVAAMTSSFWGAALFPGVSSVVLIGGLTAGAGLAVVNLCQAILRADERVVAYLLTSVAAASLPPALGFAAITTPAFSSKSERFVAGLACGYILVALWSVLVMWRRTPPVFPPRAFTDALKVGLPTIPHSIAVPTMTTVAVAIAASLGGMPLAGTLQTVAMLGTSVITVLNALNNAWAPMVMKESDETRPAFLQKTTLIVSTIALLLTCGFVVIAPYLVPLVGGPLITSSLPVFASVIVASSGGFHAAYLANIHMTFVSGRTWPLAISTPLAAVVAIASAYVVAINLPSAVTVLALAIVWPLFYALQAVFSFALASWGPLPANPLGLATLPTLLCGVIAMLGIVLPAQPWSTLALSLMFIGSCVWAIKLTGAHH